MTKKLTLAQEVAGMTAKGRKVTRREAALVEALDNIAGYILPTYKIDGVDYVKFEHADYLRTLAKEALGRVPHQEPQ